MLPGLLGVLLYVPERVGHAAYIFILAGKILLFEWMKNRKTSCLTCLLVFLSDKSDISELSSVLFVILGVIAFLRFIRRRNNNNKVTTTKKEKEKNPSVRGFGE